MGQHGFRPAISPTTVDPPAWQGLTPGKENRCSLHPKRSPKHPCEIPWVRKWCHCTTPGRVKYDWTINSIAGKGPVICPLCLKKAFWCSEYKLSKSINIRPIISPTSTSNMKLASALALPTTEATLCISRWDLLGERGSDGECCCCAFKLQVLLPEFWHLSPVSTTGACCRRLVITWGRLKQPLQLTSKECLVQTTTTC